MKTNCRRSVAGGLRKQVVSIATLAVAGLGLWLLPGCGGKTEAASTDEAAAAKPATSVVTTPATVRDFEERLELQGNVQAKHFAMASTKVDGVLTDMFVDEGDTVVAGETKLCQTDKITLEKALEIRRQDLAAAKCGQQEAAANVERAEADFAKAELDYERFKRLRAKDAVTKDAFEMQESRYKQTAAGLKYARTTVELAGERVRQAEAAVAVGEKFLSDSLIYAPLSGRVSLRLQEPGEFVGAGKPVVRIEDPSVLEVSAFLPAQYYPRVQVGETAVRVEVYGVDVGKLDLFYKSPTINATLRTFEVKCLIETPPEGVVSGAMAQLSVLLEQRQALGVPAASIQRRGDHAIVFVVDNGVAHAVEVQPGLETGGWTELRETTVAAGDLVVSTGQYLINDGTPVTVLEAPTSGTSSDAEKGA